MRAIQRHRYIPADDACLVALSRALTSSFPGLSERQMLALSQGYVQLLFKWCWRECSDLVATPDAVEQICGWDGVARSLYKAFKDADYIDDFDGCVVVLGCVVEAPPYARTRWQRKGEAFKAAQARSRRPDSPAANDAMFERRLETGLFGRPITLEQPSAHGPDPRVRQFTDHWHATWTGRYGAKYPWTARDFGTIKSLLLAVTDVQQLKQAATAYIKATDKFFMGHSLAKFYSNLSRFVAGSARGKVADAVSKDIDLRAWRNRVGWLKDYAAARPVQFVRLAQAGRDKIVQIKGAGAMADYDALLRQATEGVVNEQTGKLAGWLMGLDSQARQESNGKDTGKLHSESVLGGSSAAQRVAPGQDDTGRSGDGGTTTADLQGTEHAAG
jgi:hypothetical protein